MTFRVLLTKFPRFAKRSVLTFRAMSLHVNKLSLASLEKKEKQKVKREWKRLKWNKKKEKKRKREKEGNILDGLQEDKISIQKKEFLFQRHCYQTLQYLYSSRTFHFRSWDIQLYSHGVVVYKDLLFQLKRKEKSRCGKAHCLCPWIGKVGPFFFFFFFGKIANTKIKKKKKKKKKKNYLLRVFPPLLPLFCVCCSNWKISIVIIKIKKKKIEWLWCQ